MLLPLPANPTIPTRIPLGSPFAIDQLGSSRQAVGRGQSPMIALANVSRECQTFFKLASRASSRASSSAEVRRFELEVAESDPVECVDDLLGDVGDRLRWQCPGWSETVRARPANSLWVSAGVRFKLDAPRATAPVVGRRGCPAVSEVGIELGPAEPSQRPLARAVSPRWARPASTQQTEEGHDEAADADEGADDLENETAT